MILGFFCAGCFLAKYLLLSAEEVPFVPFARTVFTTRNCKFFISQDVLKTNKQWKTFILGPFPFDGLQKTKLKKRWQALQVNLGHFIKNTCHNKETERQSYSRGQLVESQWVWMFWYYSSYCKYYASSAFQHCENISTYAYETVSSSQYYIVAQVY